ncbi:MAG: hypothetical protein ACFFB3_16095, partial [Candidatus Hodarchaeota archaeon]
CKLREVRLFYTSLRIFYACNFTSSSCGNNNTFSIKYSIQSSCGHALHINNWNIRHGFLFSFVLEHNTSHP